MAYSSYFMSRLRACLFAALIGGSGTVYGQQHPTMRWAELPELLKEQWRSLATEMNDNSRCAAAFDGSSDASRMILKCSIHIRMAAEGARRAMKYCEEERLRLGVRAPCRVVVR
ncbi:MAG: hypothetical protein RL322_1560 [Pseudomonadota bacterium]|jgi:hypothetical protein